MRLILTDISQQQTAELLVESNVDGLVQGVVVSYNFDEELLVKIKEFEYLVNNFAIGEPLDEITDKIDAYDWQVTGKDWKIRNLQIFDLKHFSFRIKSNNVFATTDFIAELRFYETEMGGRKTAVQSGYRPHIEFREYPGFFTSGQQTYIGRDTVEPGEKEVLTECSIVSKKEFRGKLCKNVCFDFYEGKNRMGFGKIVKVINPELKVNWESTKTDEELIYPKKEIAMYTLSNLEYSKLCWTDVSYAYYKFRSICKYHIVIQSEEVDLRKMRFNDVEAYFKTKLREVCIAHIVIIEKADKGYETIVKGFKTDVYVDNAEKAAEMLKQLQADESRLFDFDYKINEDDNWLDLGIMLY